MDNPTRKRTENPTRKKTSPIFRLSEVDYRIIQLVYEHRFLDTEILSYLLKSGDADNAPEYIVGKDGKKRPARYGFGMKALYKHLLRLSELKYLNRQPLIDIPIGGSHGSPRTAYGLGIKSAPIISEHTGTPIQQIKAIIDANRVKSLFLRHAIDIARFRATLELACKDSAGRVRLIFWEQGIGLRDYSVGENESGDTERFPVNPDAYFGIHVRGKGNASYFLEMDRGTMPVISKKDRPDIRKKVFGFMYYRKSDQFRNKYFYGFLPNGRPSGLFINRNEGEAASTADNDLLQPIKGFSVLFVIPGILQKNKFMSGRIANVLSAFPIFGKDIASTSLFWLTTPDAYEIENPESIFGNIWITPNPKKPMKSLIE